ncbi:hypothetical protein FPV67DRAFT_1447933 [Lyophyllum atratum]|nr:hypothetical protein FPV67DRAFT_1447933 [Lyophyllum atratum]
MAASRAVRYLTHSQRLAPRPLASANLLSRKGPIFVRLSSSSSETLRPPKVELAAQQPKDIERCDKPSEEPSVSENSTLSLPPPVKGYPTPWFGKEDVETYLKPLYSHGWALTFQLHNPDSSDAAISAVLGTKFPLTFDDAMAFMNGVGDIAKSEKHHPVNLSLMFYQHPTVLVQTKTHTAFRPSWIEAWPPELRLPGVTRRDLRLAVLIHQLYSEEYQGRGPWIGPTLVPNKYSNQADVEVLTKVFSLPPKSLGKNCPLCGGLHSVLRCRQTSTSAQKPKFKYHTAGEAQLPSSKEAEVMKLSRRSYTAGDSAKFDEMFSFLTSQRHGRRER